MRKSIILIILTTLILIGCNSTTDSGGSGGSKNMVFVEGGTFEMGDDSSYQGPSLYDVATGPRHEVTVSSFYMEKYEVTQESWLEIMNLTEHYYNPRSPIYYLSWLDAIKYCNKRSIREGLTPCYTVDGNVNPKTWPERFTPECNWEVNGYRLPTEAEWEFAAKERKRTRPYFKYSGSNDLDTVAWYSENSDQPNNYEFHDVGLKKPNSLGIYDMTGNVTEWVWDAKCKYPTDHQVNPRDTTCDSMKVYRGGNGRTPAYDSSITCRFVDRSYKASTGYGLRVVRSKL